MSAKEREYWNKYVQALGTATNSLTSELRKTVKKKKAVASGRLKNIAVSKIDLDPQTKKPINLKINSPFYYKFVNYGVDGVDMRRGAPYKFKTRFASREMINNLMDGYGIDTSHAFAVASKIKSQGIKPRNITTEFLESDKVKKEMKRVIGAWTKWQLIKSLK